ncbi:MAG TPA: condensation domain-containing protein, partial [Thermoanaerobaculia bacterium]|nr:condensation domain-containing protein [Thermoanaerobaculia bacterium]
MAAMNPDVERIYELSPMQQAMLVASLVAPSSGVYLVQVTLSLSSRLDVAAFERAWRLVVARHGILRTGFYWEEQEKPVQVVYREVDLPLRRESWRGLGAAGQEERLQALLDADREQGFDLGEPPLLRLTLIELDGGGWQLVWSMHHILADGWSRSLLLRELFESYAAFAAGHEPSLAPPRPYEDYIAWLQRWDSAAAEAFWRRSLKGLSPPILLAGLDGHGPVSASFRAARRRSGRLAAEATAALRELARRHRLTLATVLYGAWALVVARETGGEEAVFGGTVTGRPLELAGVESMVGLFINTLPVRVAVDPAHGLLAWLTALQEWQSEARHHENAPLAAIHAWSGLAGAPLFDHILVVENDPLDGGLAERLPELAISVVSSNELTGYPLHIVAVPGSELQLDLIYDARRVGDAAATRLAERLAGALRAFATAPQARLGEVPLLLPGERQQVVVEVNDTAAGLPAESCVHELVWAQAARTPQAVAVRGAGRALRYGELAAQAGGLARRLVRLGVGPEVLVGVCAERTPALLVALLGVLEAGGAYVPLDPTHPRERLGWILADSRARVVLTERSLSDALPPHEARVVLLDEEDEDSEGAGAGVAAAPVPATAARAENLAYVIYTSGSTGRPKGVGVRHRGVVNYLTAMAARPGLGAGDVMLAVTTLSFDIAVTELLLPLSVGARVELVDRET